MNRFLAGGLVAALLSFLPNAGHSQDPGPDPRGAVMCVWMIYVSIKQIGDECLPDDREFPAFLASRIARLEEFIIRNSDLTQEFLEERKKVYEKQVRCEPDGEAIRLYQGVKERDWALIDNDLDKFLEVERPPAWNPCL